ncbi:extracellular solute-binding protein [Streptomyces spongiae]|uniref:Extracellular solute-binding protein n=1 Tax=Streptomyces spongiae TaxID=565072 RepID=A0A5N8XAA4_9ACTN|nr:extracellular solute-binding protein [Streptomyces spongiae]MPY56399.1 extracellular solute-binding protein [Streptomyces spongiae]
MKSRKRLASCIAIAAAVSVLAACGGGSSVGSAGKDGDLKGSRLVFVNYGGSSMEAAQKGWLEPFSKQTGVQFATDSPSDPAKVKAMVDSGNTTWDIIDLAPGAGRAGCGTLFEKRPKDFDLSAMQQKYIGDDCGIPIFVTNVQVVYNSEKYGDNPPTSSADFLNVKKFPGKRIFLNYVEGQVEPILMTAGVTQDKMYPIDWSKMKQVANTLGNEMTPQDSVAAATQALESGDYGMCLCYAGSLVAAKANGAKFGELWDKTYVAWDSLYAIKGSKNQSAQWKFLQYVATEKGQAPFYQYSPYLTPFTNPPAVPDQFKPFLPEAHKSEIKETLTYDPRYWANNLDDGITKWTQIMSG